MASVLPQGAILDVLKKKMRQTKEEMEKYKEECEEYHKRLQVEINRREEVRVYILYYVFMYIVVRACVNACQYEYLTCV